MHLWIVGGLARSPRADRGPGLHGGTFRVRSSSCLRSQGEQSTGAATYSQSHLWESGNSSVLVKEIHEGFNHSPSRRTQDLVRDETSRKQMHLGAGAEAH